MTRFVPLSNSAEAKAKSFLRQVLILEQGAALGKRHGGQLCRWLAAGECMPADLPGDVESLQRIESRQDAFGGNGLSPQRMMLPRAHLRLGGRSERIASARRHS